MSIMKVFISHHIGRDFRLASTLQKSLKERNIEGIIAQRKKEYELLIIDKIKHQIDSSDYLVAIITKSGLASASVHEEIGFAIAKKVPVVLMVEKGAKERGVLIHGKDPEYFLRSDFGKRVEKIIDHIIKNGPRDKISAKDKELLKTQVYEPCYNAMKNVYDTRKYLVTVPTNPWSGITSALKLKTEPKIVTLFDKYSTEIDKWQKLYNDWSTDFGNHSDEIMKIIGSCFSHENHLNPNGMIRLPQERQTRLHDWVHHFRFILFEPSINDATSLFEKLSEFALLYYKWEEPFLQYFNEKTDLFRILIPELKKMRTLLTAVSYEVFIKQREVLKSMIEKLTLVLEEKIKEE